MFPFKVLGAIQGPQAEDKLVQVEHRRQRVLVMSYWFSHKLGHLMLQNGSNVRVLVLMDIGVESQKIA